MALINSEIFAKFKLILSTFDLLNKLRKSMFGFEYQRSTILIVLCSIGFIVILIIGLVMGKHLKSESLDNELPMDENDYICYALVFESEDK
jgi:hypothetical protein